MVQRGGNIFFLQVMKQTSMEMLHKNLKKKLKCMLELREEEGEVLIVESCPINYFQDLFQETLAVIYIIYMVYFYVR